MQYPTPIYNDDPFDLALLDDFLAADADDVIDQLWIDNTAHHRPQTIQ